MANHIAAALRYSSRGWKIFPCHATGDKRKRPLTENGLHDASADPAVITEWWGRRHPDALIGLPTGATLGLVVLDIDVKAPAAYGYDTLGDLGFAILPVTPMAHTASGGLHLYFLHPGTDFRNTCGARGAGIGPGLDWRGDGGYVIAPAPGTGYSWDPICNFRTTKPVPVPAGLMPKKIEEHRTPSPAVKPAVGLSRYADAALDAACKAIASAPAGQQETTLNAECYSIGTLAGARAIPQDFARASLLWAAENMTSYDPRRPWRRIELTEKVNHAFDDGLRNPRALQND
jgi:hypothetical protein